MPRVHFTPHLRRQIECPEPDLITASTVSEALAVIFAKQPLLRGYVLDDTGRIRQHVAIFVDERPVTDRATQSDPVQPESSIYVMQALSGG